MTEKRNMFGFPVIDLKVEKAKRYAAEVRERQKQVCNCQKCEEERTLSTVEQIIKNWSNQ